MILGSYLREQQAQQSITRGNEHKDIPWGKHKRENRETSSKIESTPKVKPKDSKMIS